MRLRSSAEQRSFQSPSCPHMRSAPRAWPGRTVLRKSLQHGASSLLFSYAPTTRTTCSGARDRTMALTRNAPYIPMGGEGARSCFDLEPLGRREGDVLNHHALTVRRRLGQGGEGNSSVMSVLQCGPIAYN